MRKRKLFAFDIDGTLLGSDRQPLESTQEALHKLRKQGHLVTIATGRSRLTAQKFIHDLEFSNYILCNGAAGFLNHKQYYQNLLNQAELERLAAEIEKKEFGLAYVGLDDTKKSTPHGLNQMIEAMQTIDFNAPELDLHFHQKNDIYQALAFFNASWDHFFKQEFTTFDFIRWHTESSDVIPKNGSKAATLLHLANSVDIDIADIIAFGDGENDYEMIREAGIGVAMGNGLPLIQQQADIVTDTNDNDGIWKALKELGAI